MKRFFSVKKEDIDETKKVIRGLDSLRFINGTPFELGTTYQINLSGDVEDFNELDKYLYPLKEDIPEKIPFRKRFIEYLKEFRREETFQESKKPINNRYTENYFANIYNQLYRNRGIKDAD